MTNRTEEYWALVRELAQPPRELEGSIERARKRAKQNRLARRFTTPLTSLAAAAACFVLLVNAFPTFALACSGVPIIRELTAAVAFSPSLSAAVAHDYVQYIGQSQTVDGVTVNLEYAIVDQAQMVLFYSADGARLYTGPNLTGENGEGFPGGCAVSCCQGAQGKAGVDSLSSVTFDFVDRSGMPDQFTVDMLFMPELKDTATAPVKAAPPNTPLDSAEPEEWADPRKDPRLVHFTFDVTLDPSRICDPISVPVNRWIELDGQRILVDRLEYSPTRTALYLGEDEANTAWLKSLKFWFEDEKDVRYNDIGGSLSASGAEDIGSKSMLTYYFQSFYYDEPKGLTLCIDKAEWLDKDASHVFVNLSDGTSSGLPGGTELGEITRIGMSVQLEILSPPVRKYFSQTFYSTYWDPEGGEHTWNRMSYTSLFDDEHEETASKETIYLDDYPWDTVELEPSYSAVSEYEQPVRVLLTAAIPEE